MVVTGLDANGQHSPPGVQLQATLNIIPAHAWYALPNGALTFVNERTADYLGLPKDHPLRSGTGVGTDWDSHIPLLHAYDREETRRIWSDCLRTGSAGEVNFRVRNAEEGTAGSSVAPNLSGLRTEPCCIGSGLISTLTNRSELSKSFETSSKPFQHYCGLHSLMAPILT